MNLIMGEVAIYFAINSFLAGWYLGDEWKWCDKDSNKATVIVIVILAILFAIPYNIAYYSIWCLKLLWDWTDDTPLPLKSIFLVFFTKKYDFRTSYKTDAEIRDSIDQLKDKGWRKHIEVWLCNIILQRQINNRNKSH